MGRELVCEIDRLCMVARKHGAAAIDAGLLVERPNPLGLAEIVASSLSTEAMAQLLTSLIKSAGGLSIFMAHALPIGGGVFRDTIVITGAKTGMGIGAVVDHTPECGIERIKCAPVAVKAGVFGGPEAKGIYDRFSARPPAVHEQDAWGLLRLAGLALECQE